MPVVKAIKNKYPKGLAISIDTFNSKVAEAAVRCNLNMEKSDVHVVH